MNKKKYIDADIVNKKLKQICDNRKTSYGVQFGGRAKEFAQITDDIPAADVKEIQHGYNATNINPVDEFICSVCGFVLYFILYLRHFFLRIYLFLPRSAGSN